MARIKSWKTVGAKYKVGRSIKSWEDNEAFGLTNKGDILDNKRKVVKKNSKAAEEKTKKAAEEKAKKAAEEKVKKAAEEKAKKAAEKEAKEKAEKEAKERAEKEAKSDDTTTDSVDVSEVITEGSSS